MKPGSIAVVGAAETTRLGSIPDMSNIQLHADAGLNALADCGLTPRDIDGVACAGDAHPRCVAVGPSGVDALVDGRWQPVSDTGYDAVDFFDDGSAADGSGGWASGDKGRIARVTLAPAD